MRDMAPDYMYESELYDAGHDYVAGIDEAGRGAWAGPVVAGAVVLPKHLIIPGVDDSKKLSPNERERIFLIITKEAVAWSVGVMESTDIDRLGIMEANRRAMKKALRRMRRQPDHLLLDGRELDLGIPTVAVIRGDQLSHSIAAASIVAKVVRDQIMVRVHATYPEYGFDQHKGYGTEQHERMIQRHGLCDIHRTSFAPMREFIET